MQEGDGDYWSRRAAEEEARARAGVSPPVRAIHARLARLYQGRIDASRAPT